MAKAVARVILYEAGLWTVLASTPPIDEQDILARAEQMATRHHIDPLVRDSIISGPCRPLSQMHSWWISPNKIVDLRPTEPVHQVHGYYQNPGNRNIACFVLHQDLRAHHPEQDMPLKSVTSLYPYGHATYFTGR